MIDIACRERVYNMAINLQKINFQEWQYWWCAMCFDNEIHLPEMVGSINPEDNMINTIKALDDLDESYTAPTYQTNVLKSQSEALDNKLHDASTS